VRLQPEHVQAQTGMGAVLTELGRAEEAAAHSAIAYFLMGREMVDKNNLGEAKNYFLQALRLDSPTTIEFARRVCTGSVSNSLAHLDALAASCANAGRFSDTVAVLEKTVALAEATEQNAAAIKYRNLLEKFRQRIAP
jgi:tetratricopeptide (TPR) repeat protein